MDQRINDALASLYDVESVDAAVVIVLNNKDEVVFHSNDHPLIMHAAIGFAHREMTDRVASLHLGGDHDPDPSMEGDDQGESEAE